MSTLILVCCDGPGRVRINAIVLYSYAISGAHCTPIRSHGHGIGGPLSP